MRVLTSERPYELRRKLDEVIYSMSIVRETTRGEQPNKWYEFRFETPNGQVKLSALELDALITIDRQGTFKFEKSEEDLKEARKTVEFKQAIIIKNGLRKKNLVSITNNGAELSDYARSGMYKAIFSEK